MLHQMSKKWWIASGTLDAGSVARQTAGPTNRGARVDAKASNITGSPVSIEGVSKAHGQLLAVDGVSLAARGRVRIAPGAFRLRQDNAPHDDRGFRTSKGRTHPGGREGRHARAAQQARYRHGLPEIRALPHMTVAQNIAFPLKLRKVERSEIERRVEPTPALPSELSDGQQQRVAVASACFRAAGAAYGRAARPRPRSPRRLRRARQEAARRDADRDQEPVAGASGSPSST